MVLDSIGHFLRRRIFVLVFASALSALQTARCQSVAPPDPTPLVASPNLTAVNPDLAKDLLRKRESEEI